MDEVQIAVHDLIAGDEVLRSSGSLMYTVLEVQPLEVEGVSVLAEFPSGAKEWRFWQDSDTVVLTSRVQESSD